MPRITRFKMATLVGRLDGCIDRAEDIPDTDTSIFRRTKDLTDPFVTVEVVYPEGNEEVFRTRHIKDCLNPVWGETFSVEVKKDLDKVTFNVRDKEAIGSEHVAYVSIVATELLKGNKIDDLFTLKDEDDKDAGKIKLSVQFFPEKRN